MTADKLAPGLVRWLEAIHFWVPTIIILAGLVELFAFRLWLYRWGATRAEAAEALPGDDRIARRRLQYTQAVTIDAPPESVWPWLMQMGDGRTGLYSYDWLENLVGCHMHSADRIIPELQDLKVGDVVKIMPTGGPSVETLEANRLLLLTTFVDGAFKAYDPKGRKPTAFMDQTWAFVLRPLDGHRTRLVTRELIDYAPSSPANWLMWDFFTAHASVVMQRKMLLGIKDRAERSAAGGA